jgi:hypothetical protein
MKKNSKELPDNIAIEEQLREEDRVRPRKINNLPKNKQFLHKKKKLLTRLEKCLRLAKEKDNPPEFVRRWGDQLKSEIKKTKEIIERLENGE